MKIDLAGYNIDENLILEASTAGVDLTPETISAAYARISRDPRSIAQLRAEAINDVAKARKSNESIVFGMGHASVAEHAVFNFDISGVSRLAVEAIEHARLCSYTEKSQRYTRLGEDYVVPQEIIEVGLEQPFREMVAKQYLIYQELLSELSKKMATPTSTKEELKAIEGKAKEDARYVTCLAMEGQLGMTCNARSLEYMVKRLSAHPLAEVRQIAEQLYNEAYEVTPSLLKHTEPQISGLQEISNEIATSQRPCENVPVRLISWNENAETMVISSLLYMYSDVSLGECRERYINASYKQKNKLIRSMFENLQQWDSVPRAFEMADFTFELIVSASCFAQLKRHRMATILPQAYNPALGYTIPQSITKDLLPQFEEAMDLSLDLYSTLIKKAPLAAPYVLSQAHRRRVIVKVNARELYHFSRLRQDTHAQWDIRQIADNMIDAAKRACPTTMILACGKDSFEKNKTELLKKHEDF